MTGCWPWSYPSARSLRLSQGREGQDGPPRFAIDLNPFRERRSVISLGQRISDLEAAFGHAFVSSISSCRTVKVRRCGNDSQDLEALTAPIELRVMFKCSCVPHSFCGVMLPGFSPTRPWPAHIFPFFLFVPPLARPRAPRAASSALVDERRLPLFLRLLRLRRGQRPVPAAAPLPFPKGLHLLAPRSYLL